MTFAFSAPMPEIDFVTMIAHAALGRTQRADITNGTVRKSDRSQMIRSGAGQYKLTMKGPNKPDAQGKLTVSVDGKTLISESDATRSGISVHSKQTFARD